MTEKIKKLIEKIKNESETDYYQIKITREEPEILDSKVGGLPYWTPDKDFPTDQKGKKMFLLAQINFEKEKTSSPLPEKGLLQFFIADDDMMGMDLDDQITQKNFKVIYHENIDYNITKESVEKLGIKSSKEAKNHPATGEYKLSLIKAKDYTTTNDYKFETFFANAYKEIYGKKIKKGENYCDVLKDKEIDKLEESLPPDSTTSRHKMLGYAFFTQEDPRYQKKYKDYDTLLLQLDSDGDNDSYFLLWGDVGVGNFFITKKALEEKDFSKVLYNWDCS